MLFTRIVILTAGLTLLGLSAMQTGQLDSAAKDDAAGKKGRAAVESWVRKIMSSESAKNTPVAVTPTIEPVECGALRSVFPDERYYAVHFARYPRAVVPPAPLKLDNLIRVRPDGSVDRIEDLDALKKTFAENLSPVRDEAQARTAVQAFLPLAAEFEHHGRGRYTFDVPGDGATASRQGDQLKSTGKAVVSKGGEGQVTATLTFDASGKLKPDTVKIDAKLRALPGGQPR